MKFIFMLIGSLTGVALGFYPSITKKRPAWWRAIAIGSVALTLVVGIIPPHAGTVYDAIVMGRAQPEVFVPILVIPQSIYDVSEPLPHKEVLALDSRSPEVRITLRGNATVLQTLAASSSNTVITVRRLGSDVIYEVGSIEAVNPLITMPYIIGLGEMARIIFYHVPMSWCALTAYLIAMLYGIRYIRSGKQEFDTLAASASAVGTLFTVLATVTGAVWAKFTWGTYWNWDPKETAIFIALLLYVAYFMLRSSIPDRATKARLSAVFSMVAFPSVVFLMFVLPRLSGGLHPGSSDDVNAGPLLSTQSKDINPLNTMVFSFALFAFTMLFFWLTNLRYRTLVVEQFIEDKEQQ